MQELNEKDMAAKLQTVNGIHGNKEGPINIAIDRWYNSSVISSKKTGQNPSQTINHIRHAVHSYVLIQNILCWI